MSWRFFPLVAAPDYGVLVRDGRKAVPAAFLTLQQAKALQQRKGKAA